MNFWTKIFILNQCVFLGLSESCCEELKLETWGMADFYQAERLGTYKKVGNSNDGRYVYQQENGDNYLFYLSQNGVSN